MARCIVVDLDRCTGCESCVVSCKFQNDLPLGEYWNDVREIGPLGVWPDVTRYWLPLQCQQCADAPCVEACPTGASYRAESGVVLIDEGSCVGCKLCLSSCPYSDGEGTARPSVRWFQKATGTVHKCTLCNDRCAASDGVETTDPFDPAHAVPACVHNCPAAALSYGDLDDPASAAAMAVAAAEAAGRQVLSLDREGAQTTARYILTPGVAEWVGLND